MKRKGIVLAGGVGSRLFPATQVLSKHLLPVYNKPMIFYSLSVLMLSGIREIGLICRPCDIDLYEGLLGDGAQWGLKLKFISQDKPNGVAEAYLLAEDYLAGSPSALILGDNLFYSAGLPAHLARYVGDASSNVIFGHRVSNPSRYGVISFSGDGSISKIVEKPQSPQSDIAITGLYFLDREAPKRAGLLCKSERGELEITDLLNSYLADEKLLASMFNRGVAWFDAGTHSSLLEASNFVKMIEERQGLQIGNLDEIAYNLNWISAKDLETRIRRLGENQYTKYLQNILNLSRRYP